MTTGGSGFCTLMWKDKRIAFMYPISDSHLSFYELWNDGLWEEMIAGYPDMNLLQALQHELEGGDLGLRKSIKTPMGVIRTRTYDLTGVTLSADVQSEWIIIGNGSLITKTLIISPSLRQLPFTTEVKGDPIACCASCRNLHPLLYPDDYPHGWVALQDDRWVCERCAEFLIKTEHFYSAITPRRGLSLKERLERTTS